MRLRWRTLRRNSNSRGQPEFMRYSSTQVARYWDSVAKEFDAIYTGKKSALSRALDRWFRKDMQQRFEWVMERSGDVKGLRICDIGCGSGRYVTEFSRRGAAHVTGMDVAPSMLELAQRVVVEDGTAGVCEFQLCDVQDWKTDDTFDITIAIGLWDYIESPGGRLEIIRRMTTGKFLSAWPRFWTWRMPMRKVRLQYIRGCPVYFFRKPVVYALLKEAGFKVERCDTIGKLFCVEARPV